MITVCMTVLAYPPLQMRVSGFYLFKVVKGVPICLYLLFLVCKPKKVSDEEDEGDKSPSREKKEAMVRKLQKKFPDQDKEVRTERLSVKHLDISLQTVVLFSPYESVCHHCKMCS